MSAAATTTAAAATLIFLIFFQAALSQEGPAPAPEMVPEDAPDCTSALLNMSSCLTYVEAGSKTKAPEKGCCSGLADLVNNSPVCLCQLLGGGASAYGIQIDTARALGMPAICKVDTPPVSLCSVLGIPVASPSPLAPSPVSGGPDALGPSMGAASPPSSTSRGGRSFPAVNIGSFAGVLNAGIVVVVVVFFSF
ncbi:putative xylogen-like protein 11 [Iris pallida]|uniref:Xylogen-like protein 11 n=1 Tax=Iris pallida TaxID=29817 RepID=A0AAX6DG81_IRIPA|nr:putative xylogen-like protein 11 [Iris pallida]